MAWTYETNKLWQFDQGYCSDGGVNEGRLVRYDAHQVLDDAQH